MPPAVNNTTPRMLASENDQHQNDLITDKKWCQSFPQSLADETSSARFMVRAMYVAFSCAIRYRKILGEECFKSNYITEKLKIRSLSFENKTSLTIAQYLRSAGEAIKEGALEELAMVVTKQNDDVEALEVFSWKMHYDEHNNPSAELRLDGSSDSQIRQLSKISYAGSNSVRDQLAMLVRSLQVICQKVLTPLPEDVSVNFRMAYMDHVDANYKVDGFKDSKTFYELPEDCQTASLGQLRPGHHGCDLSCSSVFMNDAYETEMILKKYTEKMADTLGYDVPNTLYQSFASEANVSQMSVAQAPEQPKLKPASSEEELAKKVESVQLKETPATQVANTRGRRKRGQAATPKIAETQPTANFGRVCSVTTASPEKRSRRS